MTLEQLRIFVGVAEREHMTRAAEDLNVTQSAASAAIAALEARHGVALFDRVGRGITLTEAGRMFLDEARAVLGRAASAELALAEFGELKRGTLRIVASQTIAGYWLPTYLAAFRARYPGVALNVSVDNSEGAAARVRSGDAAATRRSVSSRPKSTIPRSTVWRSPRTGWSWFPPRRSTGSTRGGSPPRRGSSANLGPARDRAPRRRSWRSASIPQSGRSP